VCLSNRTGSVWSKLLSARIKDEVLILEDDIEEGAIFVQDVVWSMKPSPPTESTGQGQDEQVRRTKPIPPLG
jgi:hypothetical protein